MNINRHFRLFWTGLALFLGLSAFNTNAFAANAYTGTFSGDNSGTWTMAIAPTGEITGISVDAASVAYSVSGQLSSDLISATGTGTSPAGTITSIWNGAIDPLTNEVSGTWTATAIAPDGTSVISSGTFTGVAISYHMTISKAGTGSGTVTVDSSSSAGPASIFSSIPFMLTSHEVSGSCAPNPDRVFTGTLVPAIQGNNLYFTTLFGGTGATLSVPGSNSFTYSVAENNGTSTNNMQLTFDAQSYSITGSNNWTHTSGCMGYMTISGFWANIASYFSGTTVTLSAIPASDSTFAGWSGACTGTGSCTLSIDAAKSATATFNLVPFTVVTTGVTDGVITDPIATVTASILVNTEDVGQTGSVFVTAMMPLSSAGMPLAMIGPYGRAFAARAADPLVLMQLTSSGWQPVVNGQLLPYSTGVLSAQLAAITLLNNADTASLGGSQFCVGYGSNVTEMNSAGRMQLIATVPGQSTATASCILISNARVFAYAEANYSSIFTGSATAGEYQQYDYRLYPDSLNYLAVDTSGMVFILGPFTGNVITPVGQVESYRTYILDWEAAQ